METWNVFTLSDTQKAQGWFENRVNLKESLLYTDGKWIDWSYEFENLQKEGIDPYYLAVLVLRQPEYQAACFVR